MPAPDGISISFVPERSAVDAYLASLRSNAINVPVNFTPVSSTYITPGGNPAGVGSPTPATFANPAGNVFATIPPAYTSSSFGPGTNNFFGNAPMMASMASPDRFGFMPGSAMYSPGSPANNGLYPGGAGLASASTGGANVNFDRAASMMMRAAETMLAAVGGSGRGASFGGRYAGPLEEAAGQAGEIGSEGTRGDSGSNRSPFTRSLRGVLPRYSIFGFAAYGAYRAYESYQRRDESNQLSDQEFGAGTESAGLARRKSDHEYFFHSPIPFADVLTHKMATRDSLDIAKLENDQKDKVATAQRHAEELSREEGRQQTIRDTATYGSVGSDRAIARLRNEPLNLAGQNAAYIAGQEDIIRQPHTEAEKKILQDNLDSFKTFAKIGERTSAENTKAKIDDIVRLQQLRTKDVLGTYAGLDLAGAGNRGEASHAEFLESLKRDQRHADEALGHHDQNVESANAKKIVDDTEERNFRISQRSEDTTITRMRTGHSSAAALAEIDRQGYADLRGASDDEKPGVRINTAAHREYAAQQMAEHADSVGFSLGARNESLGIGLNAFDPRAGRLMAESNSAARSAEMQAKGIFQDADILDDQKQNRANQALTGGILQLQTQRRQLFAGSTSEQLSSINQERTSGVGTSDGSEVMTKIASDIAALNTAVNGGLNALIQLLQPLLSK